MGLYVVLMYENSVIILAQIAISICQFAETVQMPVCKLTVRPTKQHNLQLEKCLLVARDVLQLEAARRRSSRSRL